jgi:protein subunit release factor B
MTKQEVLDKLLQEVKFESWPKRDPGGQNCGLIESGVKLICQETSFEVAVSYHRQFNKNKEIALELYKNYILDILN